MKTIVVGVDPSDTAKGALRWALNHASPEDTVVVVHTWHIYASAALDLPSSYKMTDFEVDAKRFINEFVADVVDLEKDDGTGPRIEAKVFQGHPGRKLIELSDNADLLVVGSRGFGGFKGLLLGSVSTYVVHHARCPVVVVPSPDKDPSLGGTDQGVSE